jgi:hypothetical protein
VIKKGKQLYKNIRRMPGDIEMFLTQDICNSRQLPLSYNQYLDEPPQKYISIARSSGKNVKDLPLLQKHKLIQAKDVDEITM